MKLPFRRLSSSQTPAIQTAFLILLLLPPLAVFAPPHTSTNSRRELPEFPIISCYSCASEEYEPLFLRSPNVHLFGQPLLFDRLCDSKVDLASFGSTIPCDSNCVSVLEPQFFGGIQNERKPFTFVRGCSTDVFAMATTSTNSDGVPTEVEYVHREHICMDMAIGQIWPELGTTNSRETVRVCSCGTDGCNTHETELDAANGVQGHRRWWRYGTFLTSTVTMAFSKAFSSLLCAPTHTRTYPISAAISISVCIFT